MLRLLRRRMRRRLRSWRCWLRRLRMSRRRWLRPAFRRGRRFRTRQRRRRFARRRSRSRCRLIGRPPGLPRISIRFRRLWRWRRRTSWGCWSAVRLRAWGRWSTSRLVSRRMSRWRRWLRTIRFRVPCRGRAPRGDHRSNRFACRNRFRLRHQRRTSFIHGSKLLTILRCLLPHLHLRGHRRDALLSRGGNFRR